MALMATRCAGNWGNANGGSGGKGGAGYGGASGSGGNGGKGGAGGSGGGSGGSATNGSAKAGLREQRCAPQLAMAMAATAARAVLHTLAALKAATPTGSAVLQPVRAAVRLARRLALAVMAPERVRLRLALPAVVAVVVVPPPRTATVAGRQPELEAQVLQAPVLAVLQPQPVPARAAQVRQAL